jgi:2-keto-4-pentenoate hydratase/2-oxohepta-3-ene-1,7-dioic acid hydratase in catechol pathway
MKIICIGRNYAAHAEELNNKVPDEPMIFIKPSTALNTSGAMHIPEFTTNMHYELELVLRFAKKAAHVDKANALDYVDALALGIDFTARDIQQICKKKGHPWEKAKAFDNSAALSRFVDIKGRDLDDIHFELHKNGIRVQKGRSADMIFDFSTLISEASRYFTLEQGDLLFSGTPEGVGPVDSGDILECYLESELLYKVQIN